MCPSSGAGARRKPAAKATGPRVGARPGPRARDEMQGMAGEGGITIRAWEARDREHVTGLLRLLSQDADVSCEDAPAYVAETGERVVGMVTLCVFRTLSGPKAYLDHLVVAPGWRRRRIGRALVRHAIEQAEAAGASRIDLTANDDKQAGRALYKSLGFQERDTGSFRLPLDARAEAQIRADGPLRDPAGVRTGMRHR